jgi:LysM repeat protein
VSGAHTVAPGETLGGIADRYGLSLDDLVRWNGIADPDHIRPGQLIELSGHEPAGDPASVVQPGDTLTSIAEAHDTSWKAIQEANGLADPDAIRAGQTLVVPPLVPG